MGTRINRLPVRVAAAAGAAALTGTTLWLGSLGAEAGGPWIGSAFLAAGVLGLAAAGAAFAEHRAARRRRRLSDHVAHELRTPLAQIRMRTEMLLLGRERSAAERTRWLDEIEGEALRLGAIIDDLVLLTEGDQPDPFPIRRSVDLGALVEDAAAAFRARAAAAGVAISLDPPHGIGVFADARTLGNAVLHLLDDALRDGGAGQTIEVVLERNGERALLRVWNAGAVPATAVDDDSRDGLSAARRVIEAHGGSCRIENEPGRGTVASIALPIDTRAIGGHTPPPPTPREARAMYATYSADGGAGSPAPLLVPPPGTPFPDPIVTEEAEMEPISDTHLRTDKSGMLHVAIVHGLEGIHFVSASESRAVTIARLAAYVAQQAEIQLYADDVALLATLLDRGELDEAVALYFRRVGAKWDREWLKENAVPLPAGFALTA